MRRQLFMSRTKTGREIYAVGGNAAAARLSGIKVHGSRRSLSP
jgi:ribose/xylose/arabinose/galactoside ABC-type transport system permease subunit